MDSNLFIDTQSSSPLDMQGAGGFLIDHYHWRSTYEFEQNRIFNAMVERAIDHNYYFRSNWGRKVAMQKAIMQTRINSSNHKSQRITARSHTGYRIIRNALSNISEAFKQDDADEICSLLNEIHEVDEKLSKNVYSKLTHLKNFDIKICNDCGVYVIEDYRHNSDDDLICESCADNNYCYSQCMDTYIYSDNTSCIYHSLEAWRIGCADDYCTERYGDRNLYEYDGIYFSDQDDYYDARSENGCDEDDEEDSRDCPVNYLAGWHGTSRNFIDKNASKKYPSLGAELEIYVPDRDDFVGETREKFPNDLILESDGSLCATHGIEMITHPLGRTEWSEFAPSWFEHIQSLEGVGYNEPAGSRYGIHLTIHRSNMSPLAEARIAMFLSSTDNADFVRSVAQREQIYAPSNSIGIGQCKSPTVAHISNEMCSRFNERRQREETKIGGRGKFCPINFKGNLAEFRIFQSTTNIDSFQKNLEFVWALWAWTKPETASGNSHNYKDFVMWLNKRQQRNEFPTLIKFLSKRMFYGTNFVPIISPWHGLMTKPSEESAVESMAA